MTRQGESMKKGQRIGYVRVSTLDQNTERQLEGIKLDKVFTDKASGKDTKRPQLTAALDYTREGDTLIVHSLDIDYLTRSDFDQHTDSLADFQVCQAGILSVNNDPGCSLNLKCDLGRVIRLNGESACPRLHLLDDSDGAGG